MEKQREHMLVTRLRACGNFLYYQTGGKAGQRRILVTLLRLEDLTQKELQDILDISSGALSEILQKMDDAALIERRKSKSDRRQVKLALTDEGRRRALEARAHYLRTLERMFECLSEEEQEQLGGILDKLVGHLDALKADPLLESGAEGANPAERGE